MKLSVPRPAAAALLLAVFLSIAARAVEPTQAGFSGTTGNGGNTLSAASSFYRAQVVADGPVSYWRLGETSGTTAVDVMGIRNATYGGGYTLGVAGALVNDTDKAVDLNGTSGYITAPHVSAHNFTGPLSIEAWIKPDTLAGTRWVVNKGTFYYLYISDGTILFGIRTTGGAYLYLQSANVATGSWQHFVGTYDGSSLILYRNGTNILQASVSGTVGTGTTALAIGAFDSTGSYFDGVIDEVAIYNKALTGAQVLSHYERGALTRS